MLIDFVNLIGKNVEIEISGGTFHKGILIDSGLDIVVIYVGKTSSFLYIPMVHIQRLKEITRWDKDDTYDIPFEKPIETEAISYRKILMAAKGLFVQVYVSGNKSFHGYVSSIMNNYFVFHSPAHKIMYISMNHVKWLIPYPPNKTPYSLNNEKFQFTPPPSLARSFEELLRRFESQLVILDGGDNPENIGLLQKIHNNKAILVTAEGETILRNLEHIKLIQLP